jgi:hypothetical protein
MPEANAGAALIPLLNAKLTASWQPVTVVALQSTYAPTASEMPCCLDDAAWRTNSEYYAAHNRNVAHNETRPGTRGKVAMGLRFPAHDAEGLE